MSRRFRYYFRQGWHTVTVDRANLWNWEQTQGSQGLGNEAHFRALNAWCEQYVPQDAWASRYRNPHGEKEYAFKEQKHANWFRLRWL